jgi:hypothetical protein
MVRVVWNILIFGILVAWVSLNSDFLGRMALIAGASHDSIETAEAMMPLVAFPLALLMFIVLTPILLPIRMLLMSMIRQSTRRPIDHDEYRSEMGRMEDAIDRAAQAYKGKNL